MKLKVVYSGLVNNYQKIIESLEKAKINDISALLNRSLEMFSRGEMHLKEYKEFLICTANRCTSLADEIYSKKFTDDHERKLDFEEYRTLLDIASECRDGVRELLLIRGFARKIE